VLEVERKMQQFIGCDAHKKFSVFVAVDEKGKAGKAVRVEHKRETYREFLRTLPESSEIALEACGFWYWMVDEMEQAGHLPRLANPTEAKKLMGKPHKHDPLDAKGLGILLRNGTLPGVLDSAARAARPARTVAHAHGAAGSAELPEAPHSWEAGRLIEVFPDLQWHAF
jgi:hypothetical protein